MTKHVVPNIIKLIKSPIARCTFDPERLSGAASMLIPGVNIEAYGLGGILCAKLTLYVEGTKYNNMSNYMTGGGTNSISESDLESIKQIHYNGFGLGRHYQLKPRESYPHNEVYLSFDPEDVFGLFITEKSLIDDKRFKNFKNKLIDQNPGVKSFERIIFYSDGKFFDMFNQQIIKFDPEIFFTKESWQNPLINKVMEENYNHCNQLYDEKKAEEKKVAEALQKLRKIPKPFAAIDHAEKLSPSRDAHEYGSGNYQSE